MIYRILKTIVAPRYGKKKHQLFFEMLYRMSLTGMNIGGGANVADSGELNVLYYIKEKLSASGKRDGLVLFDVGANIGDYTLLLNEVFGSNAQIHSFEPSAKTYNKLTQNLEGKTKSLSYNFGLGDKNFRTVLYTDKDESGLASVFKRKLDHYNIDMNQSEDIEIKTLDSFCSEKNIKHINFLKLDVEGNEKKVIEGAKEMINAGKIDFIQFEFGGTSIDARTYFQDYYYLLHQGYQIYRIVKDGVYPIAEYSEVFETFLPTNFLAQRRNFA